MREMTITVTCDNCDEPVAGADGTYEGTPIRFGSSGELRVDLCSECYQDMLDSLRPILARGLKYPVSGNGHRKPLPPRTQVDCPRCGKQVSMGAGMTLHARKKHPEEAVSLVEEANRSIQEVAL